MPQRIAFHFTGNDALRIVDDALTAKTFHEGLQVRQKPDGLLRRACGRDQPVLKLAGKGVGRCDQAIALADHV
jgi:hypothetical protein